MSGISRQAPSSPSPRCENDKKEDTSENKPKPQGSVRKSKSFIVIRNITSPFSIKSSRSSTDYNEVVSPRSPIRRRGVVEKEEASSKESTPRSSISYDELSSRSAVTLPNMSPSPSQESMVSLSTSKDTTSPRVYFFSSRERSEASDPAKTGSFTYTRLCQSVECRNFAQSRCTLCRDWTCERHFICEHLCSMCKLIRI